MLNLAKDGFGRGFDLLRSFRLHVVAFALAALAFGPVNAFAQSTPTIAVPTIDSTTKTELTAWAAGMVVIGVVAIFIIANSTVVWRFIKMVVRSIFGLMR